MIPSISLISQIVSHLPETPARFPFGQHLQLLLYLIVGKLYHLVSVGRSADIQQITSFSFAKIVFYNGVLC
jgi:hypothetical protein